MMSIIQSRSSQETKSSRNQFFYETAPLEHSVQAQVWLHTSLGLHSGCRTSLFPPKKPNEKKIPLKFPAERVCKCNSLGLFYQLYACAETWTWIQCWLFPISFSPWWCSLSEQMQPGCRCSPGGRSPRCWSFSVWSFTQMDWCHVWALSFTASYTRSALTQ